MSGPLSREPVRVAFDCFKADASRVSAAIHPTERHFHLHLVELQNSGSPDVSTLASFIALCSSAIGRPVQLQQALSGNNVLKRQGVATFRCNPLGKTGGDEEDRTPDLCIANAALSQLSYAPTNKKNSSSSGLAAMVPGLVLVLVRSAEILSP